MNHQSTRATELYFHIPLSYPRYSHATVFVRNLHGNDAWWMTAAVCARFDPFSRRRGRTVARRRFFQEMAATTTAVMFRKPSYENAADFAHLFISRLPQ